jgi:hypothetical protein
MTNKTKRSFPSEGQTHPVSGIPDAVKYRRSGSIIVPGTAAVNDFISHMPEVNATEWISGSLPAFISSLPANDPERVQFDHIITQIHDRINRSKSKKPRP